MKKLTILLAIAVGLSLAGCPSDDKPETTADQSAEAPDAGAEGENLPDDVKKKLKSLGYIQ